MTKHCQRCSQLMPSNEMFCTLCGERQTGAPPQDFAQQPHSYAPPGYPPNPAGQPPYPPHGYQHQKQNASQSWWTTEKIIAVIAACVVVLAVAGVAVFFVFFNNGGTTTELPDGPIVEDFPSPPPPSPPPPSPPPSVAVQSVTIVYANQEVNEYTMYLGDEPVPLNVRILPVGHREQITWSSSDEGVAVVETTNPQGTSADILGVGYGYAEIAVTAGDITEYFHINVIEESLPDPEPEFITSRTIYDTIINTNNWVRITADWPDWSGNRPTVFERDRGSTVWTMRGRDGSFRIVDPEFSHNGSALVIGFPTTRSQYLMYDDETGVFGSSNERLFWEFETDPDHTLWSDWGTNMTNNLQLAFLDYQLIAIRIYLNNGQYEIFYKNSNGSWNMRTRNGGFSSVSPRFNYEMDGSVVMSISGSTDRYLGEGGWGWFENNNVTWSYCYYDG